jgi:hypothetical protein
MRDTAESDISTGPSRANIARGVLWSSILAAIVTVLFVLPAEYGVDPTGLGKKLGLTRLATAEAPTIDRQPRLVQGQFPVAPPAEEFDFFEPEVLGDPFSRTHDLPFRSEKIVIALDDLEQVEVKATMQQGDALVYSWRLIEGETVYSDFHADPHEVNLYPDQYWIRYHESETASASGSLVAPFTGNHGWYWLNIEENPVKIELEVHGYFDSIDEISRSYQ